MNWKIDYFHLFTFLIIRRLFSNINDNIIIKCIFLRSIHLLSSLLLFELVSNEKRRKSEKRERKEEEDEFVKCEQIILSTVLDCTCDIYIYIYVYTLLTKIREYEAIKKALIFLLNKNIKKPNKSKKVFCLNYRD